MARIEPKRTTDARDGSAWDVWHAAGWDHAKLGGATDGVELTVAANAFAAQRGFPNSTCKKAFRNGARQFALKMS